MGRAERTQLSSFRWTAVAGFVRNAPCHFAHGIGAMMIAIALITLLGGPVLKAYNVDCRTGTQGAIGTKGSLDASNNRHLTISIPAEWQGQPAGDRIWAAIEAWNSESASTKVVLHPYFGTGGDVAFHMMGSSGNPSCANYNPADDRVSLHPELLAASGSLAAQVEYVIRHEVGHVLGLSHTSQADSAMFAPSYPSCSSVHIANFPTHSINYWDLLSANYCSLMLSQYIYGGDNVDWEFNGDCWDYYLVTIYYAWDAEYQSWEIIGVTIEYLWTDCGPPLE